MACQVGQACFWLEYEWSVYPNEKNIKGHLYQCAHKLTTNWLIVQYYSLICYDFFFFEIFSSVLTYFLPASLCILMHVTTADGQDLIIMKKKKSQLPHSFWIQKVFKQVYNFFSTQVIYTYYERITKSKFVTTNWKCMAPALLKVPCHFLLHI